MTARPLVLTGSDAKRAADKLRVSNARLNQWPYPHLEPPPDSIPVNQISSPPAVIPVSGSSVTIVSYRVPSSFRLILAAVVADTNVAFQPGDSYFSLIVNPQAGVQANPVQGMVNVPVRLGSFTYGTKLNFPRPYDQFMGNDLVSLVGVNVNLIPGAGNYYIGGLFGWLLAM